MNAITLLKNDHKTVEQLFKRFEKLGPRAVKSKQELVARIDSRGGNVPRHLRGVVVMTNVIAPLGAAVAVAGKPGGALTSVAPSPLGGAVALGYVKRDVAPPADGAIRWDGGDSRARLEGLPLVS